MEQSHTILSILLADDNIEDRNLFTEILKRTHVPAKLTSFSHGKELITFLDRHAEEIPDFIFLDLDMPVMCGRECLKEIRKRTILKYVRVIICSGSMYKKDIDETYRNGADLFVPKEVLSQEVFHKIFSILWQSGYSKRSKEKFVLYPHTINKGIKVRTEQ